MTQDENDKLRIKRSQQRRGLKYLLDLQTRAAKLLRAHNAVPRTLAERGQALADDLEELLEALK